MPRFSRLRTEPFALGLSTSLLLVPPALAETEEAALALPSQLVSVRQDPAELDHIDLATPVSAGSRLGLSALDTPASTSSISGEEVRRRNNPSVQAAVTRSPGISFIGTPGDGGTGLSARGFSGHASVMQLFDGTRLYTGMGTVNFPSDPWMVERIDVIRGPASVLYGEGATGAVINVVPKKPFAGEIRNHLRLGYGSYDNRQLALDSGGSLTDSLSYRLNLNQQQSHGWIDRGDSRNLGISAALRWQASDDLAFTLAHDYGDQEPMNDFGTPLVGGKYHKRLREKNYNVRNDVQRYNDQWTRLTSDWSLSDSVTASNQLYYIKARRHWRNAETYEWDIPREELLRRDYLRISHEQEQIGDRQTFAFQHALFGLDSRTLVGAEYNRIRFRLSNNSPYTDVGGDYIDPWHPAPGYFESRSPYRPHSRSQTRTFALFAENRLQLNERLSLVTGVRRDQNHIDRDDLRAGTRSDRSLQGGNWRAGLVFALTPELSLYGQYSTSEDGVSNLITLNAAQQQMDLTHSKQTEVGLKQLFPDGRGEWTLAAYHIVKKKLLSANPLPPHDAQQVGQQSSDRPGGQPGTEPGPGLAAVGERRAGACRIRRLRRNDRQADLLAQRQPPQERATAHRQPLAGQVLRRYPARRRRAALRRPALRRRRQPGQPARLHGGRRQPGLAGTAGPDPRP
ncbi:putative TonB-dependent receptor [Pseudomonas aeruginosa]|nr:putative TonB-dependent receptor [Pseudomonas aeruginosa]